MVRRRPKLYEDSGTERTPSEQEQSVAETLGGRRQPGSGSSDYAKGDVKQANFLIECLVPDTQVMIDRGEFKPISEISVGDKVIDDLGNYRAVTNVFVRQYEGELVCVSPSGDSRVIRMTPEHPVLVFDDYRMRSLFVKAGDLSGAGYVFWSAVVNGEAEARVSCKPRQPHGRRKEFPDDVEVDGDLARFCGLFVAEGHICQKKVFFTLHVDETGVSDDLSKVGLRVFLDGGAETVLEDRSVRRREFYNASLAEFLGQHCGNGSYNKRVPDFVLRGSELVKRQFLLGLFSGDGYFCDSSIGLTTVSWTLAYQVRDMLLSLGVASGVGPGSKTSAQVRVFGGEMTKFADIVGFGTGRGECRKGRYFCAPEGRGMFSRFSVSRELYSGPVFNLEVEDREVFVCGSVAVHNCKKTVKKSLRIEGSWLVKITREAQAVGKEPALHFEIQGCDDPMLEREWVAVPMSVFKRMVEDD